MFLLQDGDNVVDLLDPRSTMQNIISSQPKPSKVGGIFLVPVKKDILGKKKNTEK